ncbi:hypothetical protein BDV59DRAFT_205216 [Aspergillus ambiguus]|uniref:NAD(P)-dependent oxidoreductase n=1 Tax=Aspergillus ambiguus TaxID=176160 RepID=UPI003CCC989B
MPQPKIALFGATGGCTLACLVLALKAGYTCRALARTPQTLQTLLEQNGISPSTQSAHLTIIHGNATDAAAVRRTIVLAGNDDSTAAPDAVDLIISGVGGKPTLGLSGLHLDPPDVCADTARCILQVCREVYAAPAAAAGGGRKPVLVVLSTTGIAAPAKRDVPLAMVPLYWLVLEAPHADKKVMEAVVRGELEGADGENEDEGARRGIRAAVIVRPSLLTDGEALGAEKVRVGSEDEPAVGYTISRRDVGAWVFREVVEGLEGVREGCRIVSPELGGVEDPRLVVLQVLDVRGEEGCGCELDLRGHGVGPEMLADDGGFGVEHAEGCGAVGLFALERVGEGPK